MLKTIVFKGISWVVLTAFFLNTLAGAAPAHAQMTADIPLPGAMVASSPVFEPVMMKGIRVYPKEPLKFDVLVDKGAAGLSGSGLQVEITRLSRFFIASLAVPDQDLWVNLSPYEKDRIIPDIFATTEMGKVLLEQDYLLKQAAASLTYPEAPLGGRFWKEVYRRVYETYGTTEMPLDMVNKVWIIPAAARVYTHEDRVFVTHSELDVLTDADYKALHKGGATVVADGIPKIYTDVFRAMILPELRRQVNEDRMFGAVRQVYNALVLATWYKRHWAQGLLGMQYVGRNKVAGIDDVPLAVREEVFARYVRSMRDGVYSYIREEAGSSHEDALPRKYFSGGVVLGAVSLPGVYSENDNAAGVFAGPDMVRAPLWLAPAGPSVASLKASSRAGRFLRRGVLAVFFALAGVSLMPAGAQGATFSPSGDGTSTLVRLEPGETYGHAIEQARLAFKEQDPVAYRQSSLAGGMWGAQGVVTQLSGGQEVDHVAPGVALTIKAVIPQAVLAGLPQVGVIDHGPQTTASKSPASVEQRVAARTKVEPGMASQAWQYMAEKVSLAPGMLPKIDISGVDWNDRKIWGVGVLLGVLGVMGGLSIFSRRAKGSQPSPVMRHPEDIAVTTRVPVPDNTLDEPVDHLAAMRELVKEAQGEPAGAQAAVSGGADLMAMKQLVADASIRLEQAGAGAGLPAGVTDSKKPGSSSPINHVINALIIGFWTAGLSGHWHAAVMLFSFIVSWVASTWLGAPGPDGTLRCGIVGLLRFAPEGTPVRDTDRKLARWMERMTRTLEDRGGQQMGMFTFVRDKEDGPVLHGVKVLKNKRGIFWRNGTLVFYPDVVGSMVTKAVAKVSGKARTLYNFGKGELAGFVGHVRFATQGEIVQNAAHPHTSPLERAKIHAFDAVGNFVSAVLPVQVVAAHNGDNNAVRMGGQNGTRLDVGRMRRFFPAAVHMYYQGKVTPRYLRGFMNEILPDPSYESDGRTTLSRADYGRIFTALKAAGYIEDNRVSQHFAGLDEAWRKKFPEYDSRIFPLIESALYGLPPGDSPVIPLEVDVFMGQGDWESSLRYAHYMIGHPDGQGLQEDVLSGGEKKAAGAFIDQVFERVKGHVIRSSYKPGGRYKSLADCWFPDDKTARAAGAEDQRAILDELENFLAIYMRQEAKKSSAAGKVFARWERQWQEVYGDVESGRRLFIAAMVRQFFTADREHAVRELGLRAEGTYGVFVRTTVGDDGVTVLCDQQDVAVGFNRLEGVFAFASDPRALKTEGPLGERLTDALHLRDGEVANLGFSPQGNFEMRVWQKNQGVLSEMLVEKRIYPTARVVDGKANPYFAPPPVAYKDRRKMVQEDLENIPAVLGNARREWDDPQSFNRQSSAYLAERLAAMKSAGGRARLMIIGYNNSFTIADMLKPVLSQLVGNLDVESVDANDFIQDPDRFHADKNTVVLVISKSGATFPTNLSAKLEMKLLDPQNVFGMTARIDSMLNTVLGQGLHPEDPFIKRIFLTGEFYPSEAPIISEQLLLYQQIRLVLQLTKDLLSIEGNPLGVTKTPQTFDNLSSTVVAGMTEQIREAVGHDETGKPYESAWGRKLHIIGDDLGWNFLRTAIVKRVSDIYIWSVFCIGAPLVGWLALIAPTLWPVLFFATAIVATMNWAFTVYVLPYVISEAIARWKGLPKNGRLGARKLFVIAPPHIGETQRNAISRLFGSGFASTSPAAIYTADSVRAAVAEYGSNVNRGDLLLNLQLQHIQHKGKMSVNQMIFPNTGVLGGAMLKGRAGHEDVFVSVPEMEDPREQMVIDTTLGQFGLMLAAKVIEVTMAMRASYEGRLWNPGETWSRAGVHTTPTPTGVTSRAAEILAADAAQSRALNHAAVTPGGIDFDTRGVALEETGRLPVNNTPAPLVQDIPFEGFVPHVGQVVPLLPVMSLAMITAEG